MNVELNETLKIIIEISDLLTLPAKISDFRRKGGSKVGWKKGGGGRKGSFVPKILWEIEKKKICILYI